MRPIHFLAAGLLLALACIAWFLFSPVDKHGSDATAVIPGSRPAEVEHAATPTQLDAVQPANATPEERVAIDAKPQSAEAKSAAPAPKDAIALSGDVHDANGKPVAGAKVLAASGRDGFFGDLPLDIERPRGMGPSTRLETTTDAKGHFELANARPGSLRLAVRAAGFAPYDQRNVTLAAGAPHDLGTITLDAGVVVDGRVVDSRGRGVVGARVQRVPDQGSSFVMFGGMGRPAVTLATTKGDGSFNLDTLPSGACTLRVVTDDHPDKSEPVTSSRPGEHLPNLTIALEDGFEISGRVTGAPTEQVASLRISATPARAGQDEGDDDMDFGLGGTSGEARSAKCDGAGNFTVRGLREGANYGVRALRAESDSDWFGGGVSPRVNARAGDRGVELAYRPESALVFDVVDALTQEPIEDFTCEAGIEWREPLGLRDGQTARQHPGGHVRFEGLRPKSATDKASLAINAVGYSKYEVEDIVLQPGADTNLGVIALKAVPVTRVTVLDDSTGQPVVGARVSLRKVPEPRNDNGTFTTRAVSIAVAGDEEPDQIDFGDEDDVARGRTDDHGVATITSFEGVRCTIAVAHGDHAPYESEAFTCAIAAPEERTVRIKTGGSVRATLVDSQGVALGGSRVEHRAPGARDGEFMFDPASNAKDVTDSEGVVVFEHLAAGTHRFRPRGAGQGGMIDGGNFAFQVAGMPNSESRDASWSDVVVVDGQQSEVKLVAPVRVGLSGVVRENGQPLSGAKLSLRARSENERDGMPQMFFGGGPSAKTDGRGNYTFENVKSGEYTLSVEHATRQMPTEVNVTVAERDTTFNVELSVATLEGRITGADNKPVVGARVSVERSLGQNGGGRMRGARVMMMRTSESGDTVTFGDDGGPDRPTVTDADGHYFLRGVLTDVDIVVKAEAKDYQTAKTDPFTVHANDARGGIDLSMQGAGRIEVSAFKADGSPASMLFVTARASDAPGAGDEPKTGFIQEGGKTTLQGLAPGKWRVSVRMVGPNRDDAGTPPEQEVEVVLGKPASVRFDVP